MRQAYSVAEDAETLSDTELHGSRLGPMARLCGGTKVLYIIPFMCILPKKLPKLLHLQNLLNGSFFLLVLSDREHFADFLYMKPS